MWLVLAILGVCGLGVAQASSATSTVPSAQTPSPTSAAWPAEPSSYRGVNFGTPLRGASKALKEAKKKLSDPTVLSSCLPWAGRPNEKACSSLNFVADVRLDELWVFKDDRLVQVVLSFDSRGYSTLREIFVERFGPPHVEGREALQTMMGARVENETLIWRGTTVRVSLHRYFGDIIKGSATFETNAYSEYVLKTIDEKKEKAKKGF